MIGQEWTRLAELLRHQRVVVLGRRSRAAFARECGLNSDRVLSDLENAIRDNYDTDTLLSLEGWYRLPPAVLRDVLGDRYPVVDIRAQVGDTTIESARSVDSQTLDELQASVDAITVVLNGLRQQIAQMRK